MICKKFLIFDFLIIKSESNKKVIHSFFSQKISHDMSAGALGVGRDVIHIVRYETDINIDVYVCVYRVIKKSEDDVK